jgi:hypothetical protein
VLISGSLELVSENDAGERLYLDRDDRSYLVSSEQEIKVLSRHPGSTAFFVYYHEE